MVSNHIKCFSFMFMRKISTRVLCASGGLDLTLLLDLKRHFSQLLTLLFCFKDEYVFAFKQARRREDDIAIVNTGMKVLLEKQGNVSSWKIKDCSFSFGGMAPTTVMALKTIKGLTGR